MAILRLIAAATVVLGTAILDGVADDPLRLVAALGAIVAGTVAVGLAK